ncbi:MAG: hypothetical protein MI746_12020 [Pseudomonadales bacterium]|nr:hypothetical protein [Pseudomonadales bacterium]
MRPLRLPLFGLLIFLIACNESTENSGSGTALNEETEQTVTELSEETSAILVSLLENYFFQIDSDYSAVAESLATLQSDIESFLSSPSESTLVSARTSWIAANSQYELTSAHRYFADAVLPEDLSLEFFQVQYQINHWPILPGYLDYVDGYPNSGIVNDMTVSLDSANLRQQHGAFDINETSIGFHVIEFLLWGENLGGDDPRPYTDFLPQTELSAQQRSDGMEVSQLSNNRRRLYLQTSAQVLRDDFQTFMSLWAEGSSALRTELAAESGTGLLLNVLDGLTGLLTEELLVRSLYPMLNGDFNESLPSAFSKSSQNAVSSHLTSLETLLLDIKGDDGTNLDILLSDLSADYAEFFLQNFDASKECLIVLYSGEFSVEENDVAETEFKVVECINLLTNMADYLERLKFSLTEEA